MKAVQAKRMIPKMIDCLISLGSTEPPFRAISAGIAFLSKMIYEECDLFQEKSDGGNETSVECGFRNAESGQ